MKKEINNILLVSATKSEVMPLLKNLDPLQIENNFYRFKKTDNQIVSLLIAGIGIPVFTYNLTKHLCKNHYDLAINCGIAGSYNPDFQIGSIVNVITDQFGDLGIENGDNFLTIFEKNLVDKNYFPFIDGKLNASVIKHKHKSLFNNILCANGITLNKVSGNEKTIINNLTKYGLCIETMEGAAFFIVCLSQNIKCLQIRAISNKVEPRNENNWNIGLAINNLCELLKYEFFES